MSKSGSSEFRKFSFPFSQLECFTFSSCDIHYSEGIQSLNWAKIMKTITDDAVGFIENGGWTFLDPESDGDEARREDSDDEEDDAYEPTDAETEGDLSFKNEAKPS